MLAIKRIAQGQKVFIVFWLTALVFATLVRFRIHLALAILPSFLMIALYLWRKEHRRFFLGPAAAATIVAGLLYLEMRSPIYLAGTARTYFGYNGLGEFPFFKYWPGASIVYEWLRQFLPQPDTFKWTWGIISVLLFSLLNVVGLPLLAASWIHLMSGRARSIFRSYNFVIFFGVFASIAVGIFFTSEYDKFSIAFQLLLHTRWYLFPFAGIAFWHLWQVARKKFALPAAVWSALAGILVLAGLSYRFAAPASRFVNIIRGTTAIVSPDEWLALTYLRDYTPVDSIILTNHFWGGQWALMSGLSGRASYLEAAGNPVDQQARRLNPADDRAAKIASLSSATSEEQFTNMLRSTPVTHLLEDQKHPWPLHPANCVNRVWSSPKNEVFIWRVIPAS